MNGQKEKLFAIDSFALYDEQHDSLNLKHAFFLFLINRENTVRLSMDWNSFTI